MDYESLVKAIHKTPRTQKPALLIAVIDACELGSVFRHNGGLEEFIQKAIRRDYTCANCGEAFMERHLREGTIPTHDYPKPCRSLCPGSGCLPLETAPAQKGP